MPDDKSAKLGVTPVQPLEHVRCGDVVSIAEFQLARGHTPRKRSPCRHLHMLFDRNERRVWCQDCNSELEAFDALLALHGALGREHQRLERERLELAAAQNHALISRAAKALDDVWRTRRDVPVCPHCGEGILPEDVLVRGVGRASKEWTLARRKRGGKG